MSGPGSAGSAGGRPLLESLYATHRRRLYAFLWARAGSREDALDLLQEVFLRAWRHIDRLAEWSDDRRAYWLFACARRAAIDHHRRGEARRASVAAMAPPADAPGPGRGIEGAEVVRAIDRAVGDLPAAWREVLAMTVIGGMSSTEIGDALGIPAPTVRYRLMKARQALRRALAARETPGEGPP